jgi:hypothetical protein
MDYRTRFVFHGNASAYGGRLVRPTDIVLEATGASSLPVTGGRCRGQTNGTQFGDAIAIGPSTTSIEGLFDDHAQAVEVSHGRLHQTALTATTTATADVRDIAAGVKPRLTIKHVHAALMSISPAGSHEPAIRLGNESVVEGAALDGHKLIIELHTPMFQEHATRSKLVAAADDPKFVEKFGDSFFMRSKTAGGTGPARGRLLEVRAGIYATIVKRIRWDGAPYPGARIDHHIVIVPDFGKIFFGEILILRDARRLTMVRLQLGSPIGGDVAFAEVQDNGIWS